MKNVKRLALLGVISVLAIQMTACQKANEVVNEDTEVVSESSVDSSKASELTSEASSVDQLTSTEDASIEEVSLETSTEASETESTEYTVAEDGEYTTGLNKDADGSDGTIDIYKYEVVDDGIVLYGTSEYQKAGNIETIGDAARLFKTDSSTAFQNPYGEYISKEEFVGFMDEGLEYKCSFGAIVKNGVVTLFWIAP